MRDELTVREAVRFSGFTRVYIYILIESRKIKARKVNQRAVPMYLIERSSLSDYMAREEGNKKRREPADADAAQ